jgi:hypothetical protein
MSYYAFMGGTSMSAPLISGCAALVREYYLKSRNHEPSAALLKSTLVNSSRWLIGADAIADEQEKPPNYHQGFGCVYMPWAIPNQSEPELRLEFLDSWKKREYQFDHTGQRFIYTFDFPGSGWLRLCLAWTDIPGNHLQNNLNLFLEHVQSRKKWLGNEDLPAKLGEIDPENNVEIIRIENAPAGQYMIQIIAFNILKKPQDFALVVTGKSISMLQDFT